MINDATIYKLTVSEMDGSILELSPELIKSLNIDLRQLVTIKFGGLSTSVKVVQISLMESLNTKIIRISKKVQQKIRIPANIKVSVKQTDNQELKLGPLIGILTFGQIVSKKNFWFYNNYAIMLKSGLLFVFGSKGINPKTKTIKGYTYNMTKKVWEQGEFPYPDAVMDLCYPNAYRAHYKLEKVIGKGKIFNKKTLINKLEFYNALKDEKLITNYLPDTKLLDKTFYLPYFIMKYREVFLKPVNGMRGTGILKISATNEGLICQYMHNGKNIEQELANFNQITEILNNIGFGKSSYIIQNAIPRMEYKGNPFCFRIIVNKNENGHWVVPAIFTKAAVNNGFLTNHASGAKFVSLKNLFNDILGKLPYSKTEFIKLLTELTIKTAQALDKKYGPLGKLGIDAVVDKSGKPWLIEANGNPGFVPRSHMLEFPNWRYQVYKLPLSYALYLADF